MLKAMLIQGLVAAAVIGAAAMAYSQVRGAVPDNGYLAAPAQAKDGDRKAHGEREPGKHKNHRDRDDD